MLNAVANIANLEDRVRVKDVNQPCAAILAELPAHTTWVRAERSWRPEQLGQLRGRSEERLSLGMALGGEVLRERPDLQNGIDGVRSHHRESRLICNFDDVPAFEARVQIRELASHGRHPTPDM
ncbi:hypothetical protein ACPW96_20195 [Micromonospora sp. DT81.3]